MSMLLALDATQIVLIVLIGLLVVSYPLLMLFRNKKQTQRLTEQTNSLKRGDKILTSTGIYGKIVDIKMDGTSKQVTIETGTDKYKSYMTIDAYAIYQVINDEPRVAQELPKFDKSGDKPAETEVAAAEPKEDTAETPSEEKPNKKASNKKAESVKAETARKPKIAKAEETQKEATPKTTSKAKSTKTAAAKQTTKSAATPARAKAEPKTPRKSSK